MSAPDRRLFIDTNVKIYASRSGKQVHDANIVATMLAHGVGRLLTFNVADFQRFVPPTELATAV